MYENGNDAYTSAHVDVYAMSAIIFTSGTTGTSKGVMLSHDNLLECVRASANMVNFSSRDVLLSVLPLHHTYETCCGMLTPICLGATVCINNSLKYGRAQYEHLPPDRYDFGAALRFDHL